jgi:hypothetical protein
MAAVNLIGSYNYALVALSVLIAMFASYAALDLAGRVTASGGWTRAVWLLGGAGAMGTGIWSMHYIGMLAFILPISVAYHWPNAVMVCGHFRVRRRVVRGEPTENGGVPSGCRKSSDGRGNCEYALHRNGRHAFSGHMPF